MLCPDTNILTDLKESSMLLKKLRKRIRKLATKKKEIKVRIGRIDDTPGYKIPLLGLRVPAGFPSPAQDYIEETLDLNGLLISHPIATYFLKVEGYSMIDAGINPDDILIVDRAVDPVHNKIVIAVLDGEFLVKRLCIENGQYSLVSENPNYNPILIQEGMDFSVWGVVTYVIHKA